MSVGLAQHLGSKLLGGLLSLVALQLDKILDRLTKDGGELNVSGVEATVGVLANLNCFLSGGAEDSGHVFVCLFVVVDIANIQLLFAFPNIHAKKVCIYAR